MWATRSFLPKYASFWAYVLKENNPYGTTPILSHLSPQAFALPTTLRDTQQSFSEQHGSTAGRHAALVPLPCCMKSGNASTRRNQNSNLVCAFLRLWLTISLTGTTKRVIGDKISDSFKIPQIIKWVKRDYIKATQRHHSLKRYGDAQNQMWGIASAGPNTNLFLESSYLKYCEIRLKTRGIKFWKVNWRILSTILDSICSSSLHFNFKCKDKANHKSLSLPILKLFVFGAKWKSLCEFLLHVKHIKYIKARNAKYCLCFLSDWSSSTWKLPIFRVWIDEARLNV